MRVINLYRPSSTSSTFHGYVNRADFRKIGGKEVANWKYSTKSGNYQVAINEPECDAGLILALVVIEDLGDIMKRGWKQAQTVAVCLLDQRKSPGCIWQVSKYRTSNRQEQGEWKG